MGCLGGLSAALLPFLGHCRICSNSRGPLQPCPALPRTAAPRPFPSGLPPRGMPLYNPISYRANLERGDFDSLPRSSAASNELINLASPPLPRPLLFIYCVLVSAMRGIFLTLHG